MEDAMARFQNDLAGMQYGQPPGMPPPGMPPPMFPPPPMAYAPDYSQAGYGGAYGGVADPYYGGGMGMPGAPPPYQPPTTTAGVLASMRGAPLPGQGGAGPSGAAPPGNSSGKPKGNKKIGGKLREAAGVRWRDPTLDEWPENDYRIFVGNLGNECNDEALGKAFSKYASFAKAKIVKDKRTKKTKGYGFVSFLDSLDYAKALKEMNGKYIGNRPCQLRKSSWEERNAALPKKGEHLKHQRKNK